MHLDTPAADETPEALAKTDRYLDMLADLHRQFPNGFDHVDLQGFYEALPSDADRALFDSYGE